MIPADPSILVPNWVSTDVNAVRNNRPDLIIPIEISN
jgi:hypothetical protein